MRRIATPFTLHFVSRRLYDADAAACAFRDTGADFHRGGRGGAQRANRWVTMSNASRAAVSSHKGRVRLKKPTVSDAGRGRSHRLDEQRDDRDYRWRCSKTR